MDPRNRMLSVLEDILDDYPPPNNFIAAKAYHHYVGQIRDGIKKLEPEKALQKCRRWAMLLSD